MERVGWILGEGGRCGLKARNSRIGGGGSLMNGEEVRWRVQEDCGEAGGEGTVADWWSFGWMGGGGRRLKQESGEGEPVGESWRGEWASGVSFGIVEGHRYVAVAVDGVVRDMGSRGLVLVRLPSCELEPSQEGRARRPFPTWVRPSRGKPCNLMPTDM